MRLRTRWLTVLVVAAAAAGGTIFPTPGEAGEVKRAPEGYYDNDPLHPRDGEPLTHDESMNRDAHGYAEIYGVDFDTARERLYAQDAIHVDVARLGEDLGERLVTTRIDHEPEHRVVVAVLRGTRADAVPARIGGAPAIRTDVDKSRKAVEALNERIRRLAHGRYDSHFDLFNQAIEFRAPDARTAEAIRRAEREARTSDDDGIGVHVLVAPISEPTTHRPLRAGYTYNNGVTPVCTAGFNVWRAGLRRAATAAHCSDHLNESGLGLLFDGEIYNGGNDWQVMNAPNHTPLGQYYDGADRAVTGWRGSVMTGDFYCKYGLTTRRGCGSVVSNTFRPAYVPNATDTFTLLRNPDGIDLSNPGDSGGPVFIGGTAAGMTSGHLGNDNISMPLRFLVTAPTTGLILNGQ